jgi:hypothetical protein
MSDMAIFQQSTPNESIDPFPIGGKHGTYTPTRYALIVGAFVDPEL